MLAVVMGSLEFPDRAVYRFGGVVTAYMALMWALPFVWIVVLLPGRGEPTRQDLLRAAGLALLLFGGAEYATYPLGLWRATDVVQHVVLNHVAVYVLPAESILGAALLYAYRVTVGRSFEVLLAAAMVVSLVYTGALGISYLVVEKMV
eukprot:TRINITY_DN58004_c0_g1_i1.p1 TRINITY_DN58004_c0_g1~~TRINITY_DN58004_c0_g1_i1.p1  ORF type:complete len:148 (-),score=14.64 TRINITY_DN58004_c0_g1_i1:455-898(-)